MIPFASGSVVVLRKLTKEQQQRIQRIAFNGWQNRVHRKGKTYQAAEPLVILAPAVLSFRDNFVETTRFLDALRDATLTARLARSRVTVDLVPVQRLSVPVAIVLAAEFHRWSLVKRVRLRTNNSHKWAPQVRELLSDLGTFELLRMQGPTNSFGAEKHFTLTPLSSGKKCDGAKINELQSQFAEVLTGFTQKPELYAGLTEAVENAISHAYPSSYQPEHPHAGHRWWGAASIDMEENRLRFFIFDQGAGIPFTLPTVDWWESIRAALARATAGRIANDSLMLRAAFEVGRTRTELAHRGLGLNRMAGVVRGSPSAYLRVLSGRGEIVYYDDDRIEPFDHSESVGGTLIEFSMPADIFRVEQGSPNDV